MKHQEGVEESTSPFYLVDQISNRRETSTITAEDRQYDLVRIVIETVYTETEDQRTACLAQLSRCMSTAETVY